MTNQKTDLEAIGEGEKLIISGYTLPLSSNLTIPPTSQELFIPNGGEKLGDLSLSVHAGRLVCTVNIMATIEGMTFEGWRNTILVRIEAIVDSVGFVDGGWFGVELESAFLVSTDQLFIFQNSLRSLKQDMDSQQFWEQCGRTMALTRGEGGPYFQRALAELSKSIRYPFDAPVHAYRALEFLRQVYVITYNLTSGNQKKESWQRMTNDLGLDAGFISENIKTAADPIRHGEIQNFTAEERTELFDAAWFVVRRYVEKYADAAIAEGGSPLSTDG